MKKNIVLFLLFGVAALAAADSLDYAGYKLVVASLRSGPELSSADDLTPRAIDLLRSATYDRDFTVADFLASHPKEARRLERMTLESRRVDTKYRSDGAVSSEYELPITGNIMEQIAPQPGRVRLLGRVACPCCGQPWPQDREPPPGVELVPYEDGTLPDYTGILVDARGLDYRPALFPRVVNSRNEEVYGPGFADRSLLADRGMVSYHQDRADAQVTERIGSSPLVVRALSTTGTNACDLVVSDYDAARFHGSRANLKLLEECRVGFLVD